MDMHTDRWEDLKAKMRSKNLVVDEEIIHEDEKTIEVMVVQTPLGKLKFEFTKKPRFLGTKTQFSNRIGSTVDVISQYSTDETVTILEIFQWSESENRWVRADPSKMMSL